MGHKYCTMITSSHQIQTKTQKTMRIFANAESQAIGKQYAQALLDSAQAAKELKAVQANIEIMGAVMKEDKGLRTVMVNPLISTDKKTALINQIASSGSFNQITVNFLNILVDKGRIECIMEVIEAFEELFYQASETQVAIVKSASALDE